ncbi:hypothetical protein DKM44_05520 [Deinococcus irradiatisoli]|uniref:DUF1697 domain-containing protein n=1 Tax=Deinococcus irradiatisoli TaxID=2202254 RepID=A0A2Z3JCU1_9DEIO|nr:DUF1697 domain-containing protein [Deinococcus irradiatisoli]AWN22755.1 hypothetical protein DKM44_05520 [Deinococcus irradiatisoli]
MKQIALLRGINVGGHRKVAMPALKQAFEALGLSDVQTYIQSGNVVFGGEADRADLEAAIERAFGFPVPVILRSAGEWQHLIMDNPYPEQAAADGSKVHLTLLGAEPTEAGLDALRAIDSGADEWTRRGSVLYLYTPNGLGQSKLNPDKLGVLTTTRNWRTVIKLAEMAGVATS